MLTTDIKDEVQTLERSGINLGGHLVNLAQAHSALFENEIIGSTRKLRLNVLLCLVTFAFGVMALVILTIALAELLVEYQTTFLSRSGSFALVGIFASLITILCGIIAKKKMKGFSIYPEKSLESFKETAQCLLNRT